MNRGQKVVLGVVVVGGTAVAISALSKGAKAAPPTPPPPPPPPPLLFRDWQVILQPYFPEIDLQRVTFYTVTWLPDWPGSLATFAWTVFVLDSQWETLSDEQKLYVMAHELMHIVQWDREGWIMIPRYISNKEPYELEAQERADAVAVALDLEKTPVAF